MSDESPSVSDDETHGRERLHKVSPRHDAGGKPLTAEYAEIQRLLDAVGVASEAYSAARTLATRWALRETQEAVDAGRAAMRERFAAEHRWVHSNRHFTLDQLRRGSTCRRYTDYNWHAFPMERVEYFRLAWRPYRPVAILSHEHAPLHCSEALALEYGLTTMLLPGSWYAPQLRKGVLYMGAYSLCL
jgi:hypothetical protein